MIDKKSIQSNNSVWKFVKRKYKKGEKMSRISDKEIVKKCVIIDRFFGLLIFPGILLAIFLPFLIYYNGTSEHNIIIVGLIICLILVELFMIYILLICRDDEYGNNITNTGEYSLDYIKRWNWEGTSSITGIYIGGIFFGCWSTSWFKIIPKTESSCFLLFCLFIFGFIIGTLLWYSTRKILLCKIERIIGGN